MGAVTFTYTVFADTASDAVDKAWDDARDRYGHHGGYSGHIHSKGTSSVVVVDEEWYVNLDRKSVAHDILGGEGEVAEEYDDVESKWGPTGAISLKGTKDAKKYRERNGLEGKHGTVWYLFGWAPY